MEGNEPANALGEAFAASMQFARGMERIRATGVALDAVLAAVKDLHEFEPGLAPEIHTAALGIRAASDALMRAGTFLDARMEARMDELLRSIS